MSELTTNFRLPKSNNTLIFQYIVPKQDREEIMYVAHDKILSAHLGVESTQNRIKKSYYWPSWETQVREYVHRNKLRKCYSRVKPQVKEEKETDTIIFIRNFLNKMFNV